MGCNTSAAHMAAATARRRLSVDYVEDLNEHDRIDLTEEDRGLVTNLNQQAILEILASSTDGRKMSIGSRTDDDLNKKESFGEKCLEKLGDDITHPGIGYVCKKGLKPESPNQDSWFILKLDDGFSIYAVFDGHGQTGHDISQFVKDQLIKLIIKDKRFKTDETAAMLRDCFKKCQSLVSISTRQNQLNAKMSGTTATVVVHDLGARKITVAHVGDSSAILLKRDTKDDSVLVPLLLTREHKPGLQDEKARIEKAGGCVVFDNYANYRVYAKGYRYPGLNMSRCIGDLVGHQRCGITADPEVYEHTLGDEDHMLLLCSDGVWEFITGMQAAEIVSPFGPSQAIQAAETLAKASWDRWIREEGGEVVDDITALLVYFNP